MDSIDLKYIPATKQRYSQQLQDYRWKRKAEIIRKRDKMRCQRCGAKYVQLDVHHLCYIDGHKAWEYKDKDLITLCHSCHEKVHNIQFASTLKPGNYFYNTLVEGVGIVDRIEKDIVWFNVCWTDKSCYSVDNHGRLYTYDAIGFEYVREPKAEEINYFWDSVGRFYKFDDILDYFEDDVALIPKGHSLSDFLKKKYNELLDIYDKQYEFIKQKYGTFLLECDNYYALFTDIRLLDTSFWSIHFKDSFWAHGYFLVFPETMKSDEALRGKGKLIPFENFNLKDFKASSIVLYDDWLINAVSMLSI